MRQMPAALPRAPDGWVTPCTAISDSISSVDFTCRAAYHSLRFRTPPRRLGLNVDGLFQFKDFTSTRFRPAFSGFPGALPGRWYRLVHHLLDYRLEPHGFSGRIRLHLCDRQSHYSGTAPSLALVRLPQASLSLACLYPLPLSDGLAELRPGRSRHHGDFPYAFFQFSRGVLGFRETWHRHDYHRGDHLPRVHRIARQAGAPQRAARTHRGTRTDALATARPGIGEGAGDPGRAFAQEHSPGAPPGSRRSLAARACRGRGLL